MTKDKLLERIVQLPDLIKAAIAFVTTIVGFVYLFRDNQEIVLTILGVILLFAVWILCFFLYSAKTKPIIEGAEPEEMYPGLRPWALAGLILTPLIAIAILILLFFHKPPPIHTSCIVVNEEAITAVTTKQNSPDKATDNNQSTWLKEFGPIAVGAIPER